MTSFLLSINTPQHPREPVEERAWLGITSSTPKAIPLSRTETPKMDPREGTCDGRQEGQSNFYWETKQARGPQGQTRAQWTPGRDGSGDSGPPRLLFHQHVKPVGAGAGDRIARLFFPGHFIPAPFFNEGTALVGTDFL